MADPVVEPSKETLKRQAEVEATLVKISKFMEFYTYQANKDLILHELLSLYDAGSKTGYDKCFDELASVSDLNQQKS